jgi:glucose-6-phosphate 1-dehydrogenase
MDLAQNYFRFRINPDITAAFGMNMVAPEDETKSKVVEIFGSREPYSDEMDAYERVLGDAMAGDAVLKANTPVIQYETGTWGPDEVGRRVSPPGGWFNPKLSD